MSWAVGFDSTWERDIGYGVPAYCGHEGCGKEINRGLGYVCCGSEPYGGEHGCGRFFCSEHEMPAWNDDGEGEEWCVCGHSNKDYISTDLPDWVSLKLTDESWQPWRDENPEWVARCAKEKKVAEKKFCDMDTEERLFDLNDRVTKFHLLELPGQPMGMHMGTSYLVNDLWRELQRAKEKSGGD